MTMKKILTSSVAAVALSTSAYAAGTLTVQGGINSVSSELLSAQDVNVTVNNPIVYSCGMTASTATEPGFELKFPGLTPSAENNITIADSESNETVATFDRMDGDSVIFSTVSGTTIQRNKSYTVGVEANATHTDTTTLGGSLELSLPKGTETANAELTLYSNSGDSILDTAEDQVIETKVQYAMQVTENLSAEIDASNDFLDFEDTHTGHTAVSAITDTVSFVFTNLKDDIDFPATLSGAKIDFVADTNISANVITVDTVGIFSGAANGDNNITMSTNTDTNGTTTFKHTLATDKTAAMSETKWSATGVVAFDGGATKTLVDNVYAGAWTVYGYNAQIPGASTSAVTDTVVTIVNTQTKGTEAVDAYFTLIDAEGNECTLDSTQGLDSVAKVLPGSKNKYRLSAMVADCTNVSGTAYAVEVNVPTTPTDIYSNAFVKNSSIDQFKVLPVYNNANSY